MSRSSENNATDSSADKAEAVKNDDAQKSKVGELATISDAIKLNELNVIGIFGNGSDFSALLRSSFGRIKKVKVGDRTFSGRIVGIDKNSVRLVKANKTITLKLPSS